VYIGLFMKKNTDRIAVFLFIALYILPVLSLHYFHIDLNFFEDEGPANCPGCFLVSQGQFNELPAIVVPEIILECEETVVHQGTHCHCYTGMPVKIGGNKSPPCRPLIPLMCQAA